MTCPALSEPNSGWSFCPNVGAAYFYAILFGLTMVTHFFQAIYYRKGYCWVITMSAVWQAATYAFRIYSIQNPTNEWPYVAWFVLILCAPLWTNAFVYMVFGRMVYNYTASKKHFGVKAWRFGLYFVLLDFACFLVQVYGAASASGNTVPESQIERGLHIYMAGVGLQQAFILFFIFLAFRFHQYLNRHPESSAHAKRLLYVLYLVLTLITVRIIFRLIEYSKGITSTIPNHEAYQYVFDSTPMFFALVAFNIMHPGRFMRGKAADFPSRKERKAWSKNGGETPPIELSVAPKESGNFV